MPGSPDETNNPAATTSTSYLSSSNVPSSSSSSVAVNYSSSFPSSFDYNTNFGYNFAYPPPPTQSANQFPSTSTATSSGVNVPSSKNNSTTSWPPTSVSTNLPSWNWLNSLPSSQFNHTQTSTHPLGYSSSNPVTNSISVPTPATSNYSRAAAAASAWINHRSGSSTPTYAIAPPTANNNHTAGENFKLRLIKVTNSYGSRGLDAISKNTNGVGSTNNTSADRFAHYAASINRVVTNTMNSVPAPAAVAASTTGALNPASGVPSSSQSAQLNIPPSPFFPPYFNPTSVGSAANLPTTPPQVVQKKRPGRPRKAPAQPKPPKFPKKLGPKSKTLPAAPPPATIVSGAYAPATITSGAYVPQIPSFNSLIPPIVPQVNNANMDMQPQTLYPPPIPVPVPLPCRVLASIPVPPNWTDHHEDAMNSLAIFKTFPILDSNSLEYRILSDLLNPIQILQVEQVVNPELWNRFINTRKDMLRSKSDDLQLLSKLGLDERDVMRSAHQSFNFIKDPAVDAVPYSDNMALLFHCTRSKANLDSILLQGLDERLSNLGGGLLGKGIYFADNPEKSMQYDGGTGTILICGVLLGDCLSVDHLPNKNTFVREPEKTKEQKRNFNDQFFDSIVGRPGANAHNEYVIYNRSQCCPLYQIKYNRAAGPSRRNSVYCYPRQALPPVGWISQAGGRVAMPLPGPGPGQDWPYFARTIFGQMGVFQDDDVEQEEDAVDDADKAIIEESIVSEKLDTLANFGFMDEDKNRELLKKYGNDLDRCMNDLLDQVPNPSPIPNQLPMVIDLTSSDDSFQSSQPGPSSAMQIGSQPSTSCNNKVKKEDELPLPDLGDWALDFLNFTSPPSTTPLQPVMEDCPICYNEYEANLTFWQALSCSHKVCRTCYSQIETTRTTMSGQTHTSVKCPFCQGISGIEIGTCPTGTMTVNQIRTACAGYEQFTTFSINYSVPDPTYRLSRTAFIPNTNEGQRVVELLKTAWDRRLCFTIGTSNTTLQENVLVWNIHHKTAQVGGVSSYGYPDPGYLERVVWELKAYGIE